MVVLADSIQPRLPAQQYLDGAEFELEFKQIVGDIYLCEDVGKSLIIIGKDGLIMIGKQAPEHEVRSVTCVMSVCLSCLTRALD